MMRDSAVLIKETSATTPWSRKLYNKDNFWENSEGLHYAYLVYRTLSGEYSFKPDSVFYVGKSPTAYLKKVNDISEDDIRDWQRFLWNQAVVPLLIVQSKTKVRIYTAYTEPKQRNDQDQITFILETAAEVLELEKILIAIEAGTLYEQKPGAFQRSRGVDQYLLRNLKNAALQMAKTQEGGIKNQKNLEFVHHFLTRLLFVCYLIERGMIKGKHFENEALKKLHSKTESQEGYFLRHLFDGLSTNAKRRDTLCTIFARVKDRFNGSLFPEGGVAEEKERYNDRFIEVLNQFLHGQDIKDKQFMLPFWSYDFSVIPIETISAIYEGFLGEQGKIKEIQGEEDIQKTSGAYYTPLHLAELTVDIVLEKSKKPIHELKVLDPACGSGVFLVSLFGRMAESLRWKEKHINKGCSIDWARKLLPLLQQLYGIDISPTACHITCFSVYLALLEQLPPMDVEYLCDHNEKLPPLLATDSKGFKTIHHGNLFSTELSLKEKDFDIIIGNPPWVSRGHQSDGCFLKWLEKKSADIYGPNKQIAHGFMWKVIEYLSISGEACLLLPTAVLLNDTTNKFQREWLKSVTIDRVVNFSDLRFVLFSEAIHPCTAIRFSRLISEQATEIRYESPKTDIRSQKGGDVYIREEDTKRISVQEIINAAKEEIAPTVWKSYFWGTWRDQRLIKRLMNLPKLSDYAGKPGEGKRWIKGQGIQIDGGDSNPGWWLRSTPYLESDRNIDLVISNSGLRTASQVGIPDKVHRPREKGLFEGPKVLVSQGSRDMKVAFCDFTLIFRSALQSIAGKKEDADKLSFLCAVVKSKLAQYHLFHTSANWGTERDKVLFYELLSLPFFLPEDAPDPQKAQDIVKKTVQKIKAFELELKKGKWLEGQRENEVKKVRKELEPLVRDYYDIDRYEAMLIDDTVSLYTQSFTPSENKKNIPTLKKVSNKDCTNYAEVLCEMLNHFGKGSSFEVTGEIIQGEPYSVVQVSLVKKSNKQVKVSAASDRLYTIFKRMESLLEHKEGRFVFCQNLKVFDGDKLYILKPMQMRFWSRTAALNDADEIAGAILNARRKKG